MDTVTYYFGNCLSLEVPVEAIAECSHTGECYDDCVRWLDHVDFSHIDQIELNRELAEYGAWPECPVDMMDADIHREDCIRLLWIACGDLAEGNV